MAGNGDVSMIGKTISHYSVTEKLGAGGMGEVYRARDTKLNRDVALKILPEVFAKDAERMARFRREAQVLASLNHPNIAAIYGLEQEGDTHALALELVEGPTLADRIRTGAIPLEESLNIARQIAEALEAAHEQGVIHRDLKPANVKVPEDGTVKVLDFGLAKVLESEALTADLESSPTISELATRTGAFLGTAAYMSPEQVHSAKVDKRADIWAFGMVLFEMLAGQRPFYHRSLQDTLAAVLRSEPDWDALPADTPLAIRLLLRRCLEKDPKRRLRDIGEARIDLEEYLADPAGSSVVMAGPAILPQPAWQRALPWAMAGVLGVALIGALWTLLPAPAPEPGVLTRFTLEFPALDRFASGCCGRYLILSPDGNRIAFTAGSGNTTQLYLRSMDQLEPVPVPNTENATTPFFSPDGRWVAFFSGGKLKKVAVEGGVPVTLCDVQADPRGGHWGLDDTIVFAAGGGTGLSHVPAGGGTPEALTALDAEKGDDAHRWPEFLPDGSTVLFTVVRGNKFDIEAVSLRTGERRLLLEHGSQPSYASSGHLVYAQTVMGAADTLGTIMAVPFDAERVEVTGSPVPVLEGVLVFGGGATHLALSRNGSLITLPGGGTGREFALMWVDRKGKTEPLPLAPRDFARPRLSPDGRRLALDIWNPSGRDIWLYDFGRDTLSRLTFGIGDDTSPVWSPDGRRVAFAALEHKEIRWVPADGSGAAETLVSTEIRSFPSSWSPDGKALIFWEVSGTSGGISFLPLEDGQGTSAGPAKAEAFLHTEFFELHPAFSSDDRWVAYASNESGRLEIYVRAFPGPGGKWKISTEGGVAPVWSRDGRELFFLDSNKLMVVDINAETVFSASRPRLLFEGSFTGTRGGRNYDVSPDGKRFLMVQETGQQGTSQPQMHVTLNWFEELRRRVPGGGN